ncbi:MAG: type II toxin-antitoxin system VapC family toxin [Candidatus Eremiobacteraeota bacterium]|nr:type II toxin-antitoxin system VapC family toxin [Candidatus Eremiobacteraeota bacterium]
MRLLIDTNVFLGYFKEEGIAPSWIEAINEAEQVFFSTASIWEITIKYRKGKLRIDREPALFVHAGMQELQLMPLDVVPRHALATATLPAHHNDPFDLLRVARAICERLTIVTKDRVIPKYDVPIFGAPKRRPKA